MSGCCTPNNLKRKVLWLVLWINAVAFAAQFAAAIIAHSSALLADSLDMLGDMLAYAISLYALARGQQWLAKAALYKGLIILCFASAILISSLNKITLQQILPSSTLMLIFGGLGLIANCYCFYLLSSHRNTDINMRSVWICARNDIMVNCSVLITAYLVYLLQSRWPDIIVGTGLALILLHSGFGIIRSSLQQLKSADSTASN